MHQWALCCASIFIRKQNQFIRAQLKPCRLGLDYYFFSISHYHCPLCSSHSAISHSSLSLICLSGILCHHKPTSNDVLSSCWMDWRCCQSSVSINWLTLVVMNQGNGRSPDRSATSAVQATRSRQSVCSLHFLCTYFSVMKLQNIPSCIFSARNPFAHKMKALFFFFLIEAIVFSGFRHSR